MNTIRWKNARELNGNWAQLETVAQMTHGGRYINELNLLRTKIEKFAKWYGNRIEFSCYQEEHAIYWKLMGMAILEGISPENTPDYPIAQHCDHLNERHAY